MPLESSGESGFAVGFQSLKSPTTWTDFTSGAQTAKCQPFTPSWTSGWAPSFSQLRCQVPAAYQRHRPWLVAPPLDYRLFALFEWWGARHYRRHPQRAALAQQQSLCT